MGLHLRSKPKASDSASQDPEKQPSDCLVRRHTTVVAEKPYLSFNFDRDTNHLRDRRPDVHILTGCLD